MTKEEIAKAMRHAASCFKPEQYFQQNEVGRFCQPIDVGKLKADNMAYSVLCAVAYGFEQLAREQPTNNRTEKAE